MPKTNSLETIRPLLIGGGASCFAFGLLFALNLLVARTEPGVVVPFPSGVPTNCPVVVWSGGIFLTTQPGDWDTLPRVGDHVSVLAFPGAGTIKSRHALCRVWKWPVPWMLVGAILVVGNYVLERRSVSHEIHVARTV